MTRALSAPRVQNNFDSARRSAKARNEADLAASNYGPAGCNSATEPAGPVSALGCCAPVGCTSG